DLAEITYPVQCWVGLDRTSKLSWIKGAHERKRKAGVQTGRDRVLLLWSHICSACHVLQLRRGAGVQKFATPRWLVNGCQSTPTVHMRKGNSSAAVERAVFALNH